MKNFSLPNLDNCCVAVIGMGYVGLPLAIELANIKDQNSTRRKIGRKVIGFDINKLRIDELKSNYDKTNEVSQTDLKYAENLNFTNKLDKLDIADIFIVTVPTPIDSSKKPDLLPLINATRTIAKLLKTKYNFLNKKEEITIPIVIYESTVYPGTTEEVCIPILEKESGLKLFSDQKEFGFGCGYSPERINPGDKEHRLTSIVKVTSGSSEKVASWIDQFYKSIIIAGTYKAKSIKIAEAAKVIENTQRDLNIALINELSIIFSKLNIDTRDVLEAASTKWNFLKFYPGLVGGHCIGVDPYYLTYKAQQLGYHPEIVLAGRKINDSMSKYIVEKLILNMAKEKIIIGESKVLILGLTFKKNCPDIRNTQVIEIDKLLKEYNIKTTIVDPHANKKDAKEIYNIEILSDIPFKENYSATVVTVGHNYFKNMDDTKWNKIKNMSKIIIDIDGIVPRYLNPIRI